MTVAVRLLLGGGALLMACAACGSGSGSGLGSPASSDPTGSAPPVTSRPSGAPADVPPSSAGRSSSSAKPSTAAGGTAPADTGVLAGRVVLVGVCGADSGDAGCGRRALAHARVVVKTATGRKVDAVTGADGRFEVPVPAGECEVTASAPGVSGVPVRTVVAQGVRAGQPLQLLVRSHRHPM